MLSKLFAHIKIGSGLWQFIALLVLVLGYFLRDEYHGAFENTAFVLSALMLIGTAFAVNDLGNFAFYILRRNLYAGIILALCWGFIPGAFEFQNALLPFLFMALLYNLFQISDRNNEETYPYLFNAGFFAFLAWCLSPVGWMFLVVITLSSFIHSKVSFRTLVIPLYSFGFSILIFYGVSVLIEQPYWLPKIWSRNTGISFSLTEWLAYKYECGVLGVMFLLSLRQYFVAMQKAAIVKRKWMMVSMVSFVVLTLSALVFPSYLPGFMLTTTVPVVMLFTNHLQYLSKNWMKETWFWIFIAINVSLIWL